MKCCDCSALAADGRTRCKQHLAEANERSKRYRERYPEKAAAAVKRWEQEHREERNKYRLELYRKLRRENPEKAREYVRKYQERHAEAIKVRRYEKYWSDPEHARLKARASRVRVSVETLREFLTRTHCEICERPFGAKERMQHVDHDHATGKIRGVLCHRCNTMLGKLEESLELIGKFEAYLIKHQCMVAA
jgi:hypothetical protein